MENRKNKFLLFYGNLQSQTKDRRIRKMTFPLKRALPNCLTCPFLIEGFKECHFCKFKNICLLNYVRPCPVLRR